MRALSLTQPWAGLVAAGIKRYETRSWRTSYRGALAIAATLNDRNGRRQLVSDAALLHVCEQSGLVPGAWPLGAIVAVCRLVDCVPTIDVRLPDDSVEWIAGDFSPGRYAWKLEDVRALEAPIPCRGSLGLWRMR